MNALSRVRGHCNRSLEDRSAESNEDDGDTVQEISKRPGRQKQRLMERVREKKKTLDKVLGDLLLPFRNHL